MAEIRTLHPFRYDAARAVQEQRGNETDSRVGFDTAGAAARNHGFRSWVVYLLIGVNDSTQYRPILPP